MPHSTLTVGDISIAVSSLGAELVSLKKGNREYLYQKTEGFWQRQSPVLFPIVGALSGGAFEYEGKIYPMSQHGFARDREFERVNNYQGTIINEQGTIGNKESVPVIARSEYTNDEAIQDSNKDSSNRLSFVLASDATTLEKYPFPFTLTLSYTIEGDALGVEYEVANTGNTQMYFSIGGHPAFALDGAISEYFLRFGEDEVLERYFLRDGLLDNYGTINTQNHTLPLSESLFAHDALVLKRLVSQKVELWKGYDRILAVDRGNMPHFGIWRQPRSPFLCLESWYGFASKSSNMIQQLSEKEGIVKLGAGEKQGFWWRVEL